MLHQVRKALRRPVFVVQIVDGTLWYGLQGRNQLVPRTLRETVVVNDTMARPAVRRKDYHRKTDALFFVKKKKQGFKTKRKKNTQEPTEWS